MFLLGACNMGDVPDRSSVRSGNSRAFPNDNPGCPALPNAMNSGDWSDAENDAVVATYFAMLSDELSGRSYNKAAQNRFLQDRIGRGRGSIEFKMCNVSAVFRGFGLPVIVGYQPGSIIRLPSKKLCPGAWRSIRNGSWRCMRKHQSVWRNPTHCMSARHQP